jgi:hypothetical protein
LEIDVMKRYMVSIGIVLAVLITAFSFGVLMDKAFGQEEETPAQRMQRERREQAENMRERIRNMSPEEREKFRQEMRKRRQQWENMSDEERKKFRAEMSERLEPSSRGMEYEQQLKSIRVIEEQVTKLKAAVESTKPENRSRFRELPQEEGTELREKMMAAMRERYTAIRAIEQELAKLRGPERRTTESEARLSELRDIHKLAVKEKATQTADRLDKLIMGIQRGSVSRIRSLREGAPRQRRERPARSEITEEKKTP